MSFGRRFSFSDDSHFFFSFARFDEEETSVLYFLFFFRFHIAPFFSFSLRELRPRREAPRLSQGASPVSRERLKRKEQKEEEEDKKTEKDSDSESEQIEEEDQKAESENEEEEKPKNTVKEGKRKKAKKAIKIVDSDDEDDE